VKRSVAKLHGYSFVGETEFQTMQVGAFALCATKFVKLTSGLDFINNLHAPFAPIFLSQKITKQT